MSLGTQVHGGFGFAAVDDVLADPYPGDLDLATVRLPSVPRVRSAEDDEAHHRAYWRAHVWAALHVYRRAFEDPACPPSLQGEYPRIEGEARALVDRATGTYPIGPIDSVACHAALKDLVAGARTLEHTVAALRGTPVVPSAEPPVTAPGTVEQPHADRSSTDPIRVDAPSGALHADDPGEEPGPPPTVGVGGTDFFAPVAAPRAFELKLSLRGARGLRRGRALGDGSPTGDRPRA